MTEEKKIVDAVETEASISEGCVGCPEYDDCEIRIEAEKLGLDPDHGIGEKDLSEEFAKAMIDGLGGMILGALLGDDPASEDNPIEKIKGVMETNLIFDVVREIVEGSDEKVNWFANIRAGMVEKLREATEDHDFKPEQLDRIKGFTEPTIEYAEAVIRLSRDYGRKMSEFVMGLPYIEEVGEFGIDEEGYAKALGED